MMCFKYRKLIIPYSEGALDDQTRAKMERHLASCENCRRELEAVQSVSNALRSLDEPAVEPASDLWAKVSARIASEHPAPAPRPWLRVAQTASAVAAVALVAVVAFGVFHRAPQVTTGTEQTQTAQAPDQSQPAEPEVKKPKPEVTFYDGHAQRMPEPVREPRPAVKLDKKMMASTSIGSKGIRNAGKPVRSHGRENTKNDRTEVASVDIPSDHHLYTYKSVSEPGPAGASEPAIGERTADTARFNREHSSLYYNDTSPKPAVEEDKDLSMSASVAIPASSTRSNTLSLNDHSSGISLDKDEALACEFDSIGVDVKKEESAVDALNKTEGVHIAAMFQYP